ncbi:hypothetical protein [Microbacterium xylanilyticum]
MTNTLWSEIIDGTATGPTVAVVAEGQLIATLAAIWSDVDGVRVSLDYQRALGDLSGLQALALADALREVAGMMPPK